MLAASRPTDTGATIPIADAGERVGELHVVLPSGHLDYLRLGDDSSHITDLRQSLSRPSPFDVDGGQ